MSNKTEWIQQEINNLQTQGLYNRIRTIGSPQGAWLIVDGRKVLNFCSNNYLGLANHPRLTAAAQKAIDELGIGPAAVIVKSGAQAKVLAALAEMGLLAEDQTSDVFATSSPKGKHPAGA